MQIKIGEKIRELRHRDGRTQDVLASALGVTCQAISRWEANGGYPDMEIVPAIANYFHVSIDELFGYHGDREEKIRAIIDRADQAMKAQGNVMAQGNGDITECVEMLRAAAEEYPNEPQILLKLANALYMLGWQKFGARAYLKDDSEYIYEVTEYHAQNIYWQEALQVCEKLMKMDTSAENRSTPIYLMISLYQRMGEYEKAKTLANEQNSIILSKEVLLSRAAAGEEMDQYQGELIIALLQELYVVISDSVSTKIPIRNAEYGRTVLLSLANLFETVFIDGRCGSQHPNIRYLYLTLASYEAQFGGDIQKALDYFDKGFENHKEYCRICGTEEYSYSAPLVSKVTASRKKLPPVSEEFWKTWTPGMPTNLCDELRKNEKYAECFE